MYRNYHANVDGGHYIESLDKIKEMSDKLIKNFIKYPNKDKAQHQILALRRAIK